MNRMNFTDSPNCECSEDRESIDHFLLHCELYKEARKNLLNSIFDIWNQKKSIGNLSVSKHLLLGPNFSPKLNAKEDIKVKLALFEFLQSTKAI